MILIDTYVKFLVKHQLTEKQMLGLLLAYHNRADLNAIYKDGFGTKEILPLKDKEVLKEKGLVKLNNLGKYVLTKKFKDLFVTKEQATDDIFEIYPLFMIEDGVKKPANVMDRRVFANLYHTSIFCSIEEHEEVLKDIQYGKAYNLLNMGIEKFLKSKYWINIRKIRLKT